ncbi:hypothetical protein GPECTOR_111g245 [Gonium pectorale]|uniref:BRO1 domain-containing protein n=1 Tax=Gonium pectorale TaxID=33097 RepID=A0A150FZ84_GONPE|nr:hypothetical protein GPECTOR_111g245 [Gonium pectorale]|eukprot:KXZ42912.1 hypothetical protein GPECTOR_111g245 [Gonium pectorale]
MPTAQSVMLAIHCKKTDTTDVKTPLLTYIRATYSDREADDAADDVEKVQSLRAEVGLAQSGTQPGVRDTLIKYYRCLNAIETRFPISKEKSAAQVNFAWYDAFRPSRRVVQPNLHYEKAAVLFNLAALSSQAGPLGQLSTEACGLFALLRESESPKTDSPKPMDLTTECAGLLEKLMLTQAQECVYHKAVIDKKSPNVLARLAKQAGTMYDEVERAFAAPSLANYFDKSWAQHVSLKASIYQVEELIQLGQQYRSEDKVNNQIAVLKEAFARLQNTRRIARAISTEMSDSVNRTQVRQFPGSAVRSARSLSRYTESVDGLLRQQFDRLAAATDNARLKLAEWELPDTLKALDARPPSALPEALSRELAEIEAIGGVNHLKGILAEIGELRREVDADLMAAQ